MNIWWNVRKKALRAHNFKKITNCAPSTLPVFRSATSSGSNRNASRSKSALLWKRSIDEKRCCTSVPSFAYFRISRAMFTTLKTGPDFPLSNSTTRTPAPAFHHNFWQAILNKEVPFRSSLHYAKFFLIRSVTSHFAFWFAPLSLCLLLFSDTCFFPVADSWLRNSGH